MREKKITREISSNIFNKLDYNGGQLYRGLSGVTQPRCTAVLCKSPLTDCYEFTALIKQFKIVSFYFLDPRFGKFNPP